MIENHPDYDPPTPILYLHDWVKYNEGPRCEGYVCIVCREQWTPHNELEPCANQERREARGIPRPQGDSFGKVEIYVGSLQKRIQTARRQQVDINQQKLADEEAYRQQQAQIEKRAKVKAALDKLRSPMHHARMVIYV